MSNATTKGVLDLVGALQRALRAAESGLQAAGDLARVKDGGDKSSAFDNLDQARDGLRAAIHDLGGIDVGRED